MKIWKDVVGYEGSYRISNDGSVESCERIVSHPHTGTRIIRGRLLKLTTDKNGYHTVQLYKDSKAKILKVHRLVALHFCDKIEGNDVVNHIDNRRDNNCYLNLEWTTPLGNTQHMKKQGRSINFKGEECSWSRLTESDVHEIRRMCEEGVTQKEIGMKYNISQQQVSKIKNQKRWQHV